MQNIYIYIYQQLVNLVPKASEKNMMTKNRKQTICIYIYVHKQTGSKHKISRLLIERVENDVKSHSIFVIYYFEFNE